MIWKKNCWVLNANESSDWIIHQRTIFGLGYNPSTYTFLKYCSIGDSTSGKFGKSWKLTLNKNNRFWMPASLKHTWNCEKSEIPWFVFLWEVFCPPPSQKNNGFRVCGVSRAGTVADTSDWTGRTGRTPDIPTVGFFNGWHVPTLLVAEKTGKLKNWRIWYKTCQLDVLSLHDVL